VIHDKDTKGFFNCCIDNIYASQWLRLLAHMKSPVTENIPFGAVVSITSRGRVIFLNNRLRLLGLSAGQFPILMLLAKEQNIMQENLVRYYDLDKGTIARAVKKLEDGGFIRRIVDPTNRRAVRLFLSEKGEQAAAVLPAIDREWEEHICAGLSPKKRETLYTLMRTVAQNSHRVMHFSGDISHAED
jgi:DNA-binding MarR family transcriptional regulator